MIEYPITFDKCPVCHHRERVVEQEINEEKKSGRIAQDRIPCSEQKVLTIVDPSLMPIAFPVLKLYKDICANCGFEYYHTILRDKMTMDQLQNLLRQQLGMPSVNPFGK